MRDNGQGTTKKFQNREISNSMKVITDVLQSSTRNVGSQHTHNINVSRGPILLIHIHSSLLHYHVQVQGCKTATSYQNYIIYTIFSFLG